MKTRLEEAAVNATSVLGELPDEEFDRLSHAVSLCHSSLANLDMLFSLARVMRDMQKSLNAKAN